ncbi:hypothetical protein [Luteimonas sp. MHLX1A]|mgnify:CR=1 FL=1|uniref:hypothetical protein n=1 Tax=Alterluteimonas muca TaxID=2878684 RepID=UPI001E2B35B5|nr:hypothetical protein [Luteimonas sp. MHLX1A]MCD9046227.1 hypothetical protein [Luteimonas sp. MHLX1A]
MDTFWFDGNSLAALAIAGGFIFAGARFLTARHASRSTRVVLGLALLGIGLGCCYHLIHVIGDPTGRPVYLGLVAGLVGLGINQAMAPLRAAAGHAD